MIRQVVTAARPEKKRDLEMALLLRSLGWPLFRKYTHVTPTKSEGFRELACAMWPQGTPIMGAFTVEVGAATWSELYRAVIKATSQMLVEVPETNRAVLDDRVWDRHDSYVMTHLPVRDDLRSMILDASKMTDVQIERKIRKGHRAAVKFSKSAMGKISTALLCDWMKAGFIGSPAGAMISGAADVELGWGALVPGNGIPLVICVNEVKDGKCILGVTPDHRAIDGPTAGKIRMFLSKRITELLEAE
jgi:hypothetical protein